VTRRAPTRPSRLTPTRPHSPAPLEADPGETVGTAIGQTKTSHERRLAAHLATPSLVGVFFPPGCWIECSPVPVKSPRAVIDQYVAEWNADFRANLWRAGGNLRDEEVPTSFQVGKNCKDPQYP
jgi:hypothetical protein